MKPRLPLTLLTVLPFLFSAAHAQSLKVGERAPTITVTTDSGTPLDLGQLYKKQPYTLVYFFPKAETPGCTKQGCSLRDSYEVLQQHGVAVVGISHDTVAEQKKFKARYHFPFTLVADPHEVVSRAFGVPDYMMTHLAHRSAYLIKDGTVVYTDYKGTTDKQAQKILDFLKSQNG